MTAVRVNRHSPTEAGIPHTDRLFHSRMPTALCVERSPGDAIRVWTPLGTWAPDVCATERPKKPIGCAKGHSSPVVLPASTVAGALMLPLPLEAIAKRKFSA